MTQSYDLALVQGQRYERGFRYKVDGTAQDLSAYEWRGQARQKESVDSDLILDLGIYLELDVDDPTVLWLSIPGTITAAVGKVRDSAAWDLFLWPAGVPDEAICLVEGAVTLNLASTDLR